MKNDNKLIADFMGVNVITIDDVRENKNPYISSADGHLESDLKYHSSWDWLMPVVEKIERQYKTNFIIKCIWNEFNECSYYQVIVTIEQGEMSKDRSCIYDSKKIYDYIGDTSKCKKEATYEAVVEFIKNLN